VCIWVSGKTRLGGMAFATPKAMKLENPQITSVKAVVQRRRLDRVHSGILACFSPRGAAP
jgi:hypothetical protein